MIIYNSRVNNRETETTSVYATAEDALKHHDDVSTVGYTEAKHTCSTTVKQLFGFG